MKYPVLPCLAAVAGLAAGFPAGAYPLDGYPDTGIKRLEAYRMAGQGARRPSFLTRGEMMPARTIGLRLRDAGGFSVPSPDPELSERIKEMLGADAPHYGIAVLDFSKPSRPRYAAHNPSRPQSPGSVGKIAVLLGWFQALADIHPDDEDARRRLLYDTEIVANDFIRTDEHLVPAWDFGSSAVDRRPIQEGDRANIWTYLDWMASASSNAAASMMISELMLLRHFGADYPVPRDRAEAYFRDTPRERLGADLREALVEPLSRNGLDPETLRQGSFFTRAGKQKVPGTGSTATAGALLDYVVQMERGRLVDAFSSLEIKKLLYLTDQRIRYAAAPVLDDAAVYFKSGSLYGCKPEKGYQCTKFMGNRINFMNSVVVVETVGRNPELRYAVVVLSNVLKKNSSDVHQALAERIHRIIESFHPATPQPSPLAAGDPPRPSPTE
jgi:hypothetical protein